MKVVKMGRFKAGAHGQWMAASLTEIWNTVVETVQPKRKALRIQQEELDAKKATHHKRLSDGAKRGWEKRRAKAAPAELVTIHEGKEER